MPSDPRRPASRWHGAHRKRPTLCAPALALVCTLIGAPAQGRVVERIAAVVNKEIILLGELRERLAPMEAQLKRIPDRAMRKQRRAELGRQALDQMIDDKLIGQESRTLKLEVKDTELEKAIDEVMRRNNLTREQLGAALAREGKSIPEYKRQILRPQLLRLKVLNVRVRSRISVREDEIKAIYQQNMRKLGVETKVKVRHLFIAALDPDNVGEVAKRERLARELSAKIKRGEDFATLAREHSDDSVSRPRGGEMDYFARGTLPTNVEDKVFAAKEGEIVGPLRSTRGFHLIQVLDRQESSARPYKEVRGQLHNQIYGQKMEKATRAWLAEVRKRSYVDIRL